MNNEITSSILTLHGEGETEISPQAIINAYHFRAWDELVTERLKILEQNIFLLNDSPPMLHTTILWLSPFFYLKLSNMIEIVKQFL